MEDSDQDSIIHEKDSIIVYIGHQQVYFVDAVERGKILNIRAGNFHHDDMIGKPYGSKVVDRKTQRWCCVLHPTAELIARSLTHRTQIIYQTDCNTLLMLMNVNPGHVVIDCGTGSGAFALQVATAVAPHGVVHTFEFHEGRHRKIAEDFIRYKFNHIIQAHWQDVYQNGFQLPEQLDIQADAVFLDLPQPWKAMPHVLRHLKPLGSLCTFSPCIEQMHKSVEWLRHHHFQNIRVFESLSKKWGTLHNNKTQHGSPTECSEENKDPTQSKEHDTIEQQGTRTLCRKKRQSSLPVDHDIPLSQFQFPMRGHTSYLLLSYAPPTRDVHFLEQHE